MNTPNTKEEVPHFSFNSVNWQLFWTWLNTLNKLEERAISVLQVFSFSSTLGMRAWSRRRETSLSLVLQWRKFTELSLSLDESPREETRVWCCHHHTAWLEGWLQFLPFERSTESQVQLHLKGQRFAAICFTSPEDVSFTEWQRQFSALPSPGVAIQVPTPVAFLIRPHPKS